MVFSSTQESPLLGDLGVLLWLNGVMVLRYYGVVVLWFYGVVVQTKKFLFVDGFLVSKLESPLLGDLGVLL